MFSYFKILTNSHDKIIKHIQPTNERTRRPSLLCTPDKNQVHSSFQPLTWLFEFNKEVMFFMMSSILSPGVQNEAFSSALDWFWDDIGSSPSSFLIGWNLPFILLLMTSAASGDSNSAAPNLSMVVPVAMPTWKYEIKYLGFFFDTITQNLQRL